MPIIFPSQQVKYLLRPNGKNLVRKIKGGNMNKKVREAQQRGGAFRDFGKQVYLGEGGSSSNKPNVKAKEREMIHGTDEAVKAILKAARTKDGIMGTGFKIVNSLGFIPINSRISHH